ncbi:hypothetical protein PB01_03795 [Psychrobacillus glaciei]|uniref:SbsC C-terminal domain-containing protein n=1 Tax=Psychrobacillus glaciei TaxID=2283160 RepID=A0A5J6SJZ1_9BACI|nr:hypothetical protein [Psychrobacillus glaciei]QFF98009.1 hypothetical protein PB01_03795 [Psychrobacillus glaciei]
MNKRFIKQTTAAVLLTTSVLSFSPVAFGASTSVDQSISKVKLELSKATTHYVNPALDGKLASVDTLYTALNSVKKNYQNAVKEIKSSKLSQKEKDAKLKEIETLYNEKVTKGLAPYIDAYNYATKYLDPLLADIKAAEAKNDFAAVEKAYHELSYQLKGRTAILYRFSGKASRDLLLDKYKQPSDQKRDELMVPVTIYMKLVEVEKLVKEGKLDEAKKVLETIQALVEQLPTTGTSSFVKELVKTVDKVTEVVAPVAPVTPPAAGGGGGGGGGETSQTGNDLLKAALEKQIQAGNASGDVLVSLSGKTFTVKVKKAESTLGSFTNAAKPVFAAFKGNTVVNSVVVKYIAGGNDVIISNSNVNSDQDFEVVISKALAQVGLKEDSTLDILIDHDVTFEVKGTIDGKSFDDKYTFSFKENK